MIKVNEYFSGKVKSLALQTADGPATVGVIAPGEYEFGTASQEVMKIVSGTLSVLLPETTIWQDFSAGQSFIVEANKKFKVKTGADTAYICFYK